MAKLLEINNTISNIEIHGYCDIDGNSDYNLKLSERRCHSVMEELSKNGLVKSEIKKYAHGESVQINSNPSLDRKAANRRVLITYKE
jgi:outer membrane protein OmpA-like peptidoglycan-associated protein